MFRGLILFSAVAVLGFTNIATAADRNAPSAMEALQQDLAGLSSDSLIGWDARALTGELPGVQKEIADGAKLLRKHQYRIGVISVAFDALQAWGCFNREQRTATILDIADKNAIQWTGVSTAEMLRDLTDAHSFSIENVALYQFVRKFAIVPVEHFPPGRCRDIWQHLQAVRAQQHLARTAAVLDHYRATRAVIVAEPLFAWQVWLTVRWMGNDDAFAYFPIDTGQVFSTSSATHGLRNDNPK